MSEASEALARIIAERDRLIGLVEDHISPVNDAGYPPAEFVYESFGRRFEVTVKELAE